MLAVTGIGHGPGPTAHYRLCLPGCSTLPHAATGRPRAYAARRSAGRRMGNTLGDCRSGLSRVGSAVLPDLTQALQRTLDRNEAPLAATIRAAVGTVNAKLKHLAGK